MNVCDILDFVIDDGKHSDDYAVYDTKRVRALRHALSILDAASGHLVTLVNEAEAPPERAFTLVGFLCICLLHFEVQR